MAQLARADFQERKVKGLNLVRKGACKSEKCERPIKGRRELTVTYPNFVRHGSATEFH